MRIGIAFCLGLIGTRCAFANVNDMRYQVGWVLEGASAQEMGEGSFADAGVASENERWHGFCVVVC